MKTHKNANIVIHGQYWADLGAVSYDQYMTELFECSKWLRELPMYFEPLTGFYFADRGGGPRVIIGIDVDEDLFELSKQICIDRYGQHVSFVTSNYNTVDRVILNVIERNTSYFIKDFKGRDYPEEKDDCSFSHDKVYYDLNLDPNLTNPPQFCKIQYKFISV